LPCVLSLYSLNIGRVPARRQKSRNWPLEKSPVPLRPWAISCAPIVRHGRLASLPPMSAGTARAAPVSIDKIRISSCLARSGDSLPRGRREGAKVAAARSRPVQLRGCATRSPFAGFRQARPCMSLRPSGRRPISRRAGTWRRRIRCRSCITTARKARAVSR
jgi:hypothetical protein